MLITKDHPLYGTIRWEFKLNVPKLEAEKFAKYDEVCGAWHVGTIEDALQLTVGNMVQALWGRESDDTEFTFVMIA